MRFGVVIDINDFSAIEKAAALGFDYVEGHVTRVAELTDERFAELRSFLETSPVKMEAVCVLLPGKIKVTGPEADPVKQAEYLDKVLPRLAALGTDAVVFGSGGARRVPEDFDRATAWHQLVEFGRMVAEKAEQNGLTIALEPLNTKETNIITTQMDGVRLMQDVDRPAFAILSDYYHVFLAGDGVDEIAACGDRLYHTHIANPIGRVTMKHGDPAPVNYDVFFEGLARCGYHGRLSVECTIHDMDAELPEALDVMRTEAAKYGL